MAVEPAFLSLQRPSGTAQVSGTMDPPKEGTKLFRKFFRLKKTTPIRSVHLKFRRAQKECCHSVEGLGGIVRGLGAGELPVDDVVDLA